MVDALGHEKNDVLDLVKLPPPRRTFAWSATARRSRPRSECDGTIVDTYRAPNRTLEELALRRIGGSTRCGRSPRRSATNCRASRIRADQRRHGADRHRSSRASPIASELSRTRRRSLRRRVHQRRFPTIRGEEPCDPSFLIPAAVIVPFAVIRFPENDYRRRHECGRSRSRHLRDRGCLVCRAFGLHLSRSEPEAIVTILHIDSSINLESSATRAISKSIVDQLKTARAG